MNRQRLILFVLVIVLLIAALWSYTAVPRPKTVAKLTYAPGQPVKPAPASSRPSVQETHDDRILNMSLLERAQSDFKGYRRNIFKPIFVDEQKIIKQKAVALKPPQLPPLQPQKAASAVQPPAQPEAAALARFTFLGFLKKDSQKTIFLSKGGDIILVKIGEKIAGRYEAYSITEQALTLIDTDTGNEIVVPLIENKPLEAAAK